MAGSPASDTRASPEMRGDSRGISEMTGVAVLILLTVLVTASVGVSVIIAAETEEATSASFQFDYLDDAGALLVTHDGGAEFTAGRLYVDGPENNVTWAEIAGNSADTTVGPGDVIQVSGSSPYGSSVSDSDRFEIVHVPQGGNRTVVATWPEDGGGDDGPDLGDA